MMMVGSEVKGKAAGPALHFLALLPYRVHKSKFTLWLASIQWFTKFTAREEVCLALTANDLMRMTGGQLIRGKQLGMKGQKGRR